MSQAKSTLFQGAVILVGEKGLELFSACDKIRRGGLRKAAKQGKLKQPPAVFAYRFKSSCTYQEIK